MSIWLGSDATVTAILHFAKAYNNDYHSHFISKPVIIAVACPGGVGKTTWICQQLASSAQEIPAVQSLWKSVSRQTFMAISVLTPVSTFDLIQIAFNHRDLIPLQQDLLWRIERGVVRTLTWSEAGNAIALGYWGSGDVVGQPLCRVNPYEIECLTNVEVTPVPSHRWHQVLDAILLHTQQTEELLSIVRYEQIRERLLQFLIWLSRKFGRDLDQGQLIDLRLTHQEIAEVIGTTRVTVTRLLNQFEQEGIINRPCRHFILLRKNYSLMTKKA
jgi:CRP-like cAMP-binding protein